MDAQFEALITPSVATILERIEASGDRAYLVGGALRNALIGIAVNDVDIATSQTPERLLETFSDFRVLEVGKSFGTVVVRVQEQTIEVTTFRAEEDYVDGRHPSVVRFTRDIHEDLKRRDFAMNALAFHPTTGLIDDYGGLEDITHRRIRAVGDPKQRFKEDKLRMLRAVRFAVQLGFDIDPSLITAAKAEAPNIVQVSKERIRMELLGMLMADQPSTAIDYLSKMNLLHEILPDINRMIGFDQYSSNHQHDLYHHTLHVLDNAPPKASVRLAALFHDAGKPQCFFRDEQGEGHFYGHQEVSADIAEKWMTDYRFSKEEISQTTILIRRHMDNMNIYTERSVRRLVGKFDRRMAVFDLFDLQEADVSATLDVANRANVESGRKLARKVIAAKDVVNVSGLAIDGNDLIRLGMPRGKAIGEMLQTLTDLVIDNRMRNEKEDLLEEAKRRISGG